MNNRATLVKRSGRGNETFSSVFAAAASRYLDRHTRLPHVACGSIALLIAMPLARAAEVLPPRPTASPTPTDPAQEQFVRGLRARFNLQQSDSGLLFRVTQPSSGPRARPSDTVTITFAARLLNGATLPALSARETKVKVAELPPGLAEAAQVLPIGAKATLCVLPHLSFGSGAWPKGVRPGSPIFYEVEVHDIAAAAD